MIIKLAPLSLSLLLFTACSTQNIQPPTINIEHNRTNESNKTQVVNTTTLPVATLHTISPSVPTTHSTIILEDTTSRPQTTTTYIEQPNYVENTQLQMPIYDEQPLIRESFATIPSSSIPTQPMTVTSGLTGSFAGNYKLLRFINRMQVEHQFDSDYLYNLFSGAQNLNELIEEPCPTRNCNTNIRPQGKWQRYRGMFIYERNIQRGVKFWEKHKNALNKAYQVYGVLPEYIMGILGVETAYGVNFGKKRVLDVLTTKAMLSHRREDFYTKQLEKFLLMARHSNLDASRLMGSDAGAMGYGQFIASSYLDFAVDFNNDGVIDLWNAEDAIGSIANYFARNGWQRGVKEVAVRAKYPGRHFNRLKTGYKTKYSQYKLRKKYKIVPRTRLTYKGPVSLIKLPNKYAYDELWLGTHNFRVITTYNHSTFYGMAVFQLGQAVKKRRYRR